MPTRLQPSQPPRAAERSLREREASRTTSFSQRLDQTNPKPQQVEDSYEVNTPQETLQEVLMTPQSYGANNLGFEDENDLDIPTYLRNMKNRKR